MKISESGSSSDDDFDPEAMQFPDLSVSDKSA